MKKPSNAAQVDEPNYLANVSDLMAAFSLVLLLALILPGLLLTQDQRAAIQSIKEQKDLGDKDKVISEQRQELNRLLEEIKRIAAIRQENAALRKKLADLQKLAAEIPELKSEIERLKPLLEGKEDLAEKLKALTAERDSLARDKEKALAEAKEAKEGLNQLESKIAGADIARTNLLMSLEARLKEKNIPVEIDPANGVLRLPENSITFPTGKYDLVGPSRERLALLRGILEDELKCYEANQLQKNSEKCIPLNKDGQKLDAVFIEGHTDNQTFKTGNTDIQNRELSAKRANTVYSTLLQESPLLKSFTNPEGQPLFSLSGYGDGRPVKGHEHEAPTDDEVNRRIEIRFLMANPVTKAYSANAFERTRATLYGRSKSSSEE